MGLASVASNCTFLSPYLAFDAIFFSMYKLSISPKRSWGSFVNASFYCTGAKKITEISRKAKKVLPWREKSCPAKEFCPSERFSRHGKLFLPGKRFQASEKFLAEQMNPTIMAFIYTKKFCDWICEVRICEVKPHKFSPQKLNHKISLYRWKPC